MLLGNAVQTVPQTRFHIAALVTETVGVMLHAVSIVHRMARLILLLAVPAVEQTLGTVASPVAHAVVEQGVARNIKADCGAVAIQQRGIAAVRAVKLALVSVALRLQIITDLFKFHNKNLNAKNDTKTKQTAH